MATFARDSVDCVVLDTATHLIMKG